MAESHPTGGGGQTGDQNQTEENDNGSGPWRCGQDKNGQEEQRGEKILQRVSAFRESMALLKSKRQVTK